MNSDSTWIYMKTGLSSRRMSCVVIYNPPNHSTTQPDFLGFQGFTVSPSIPEISWVKNMVFPTWVQHSTPKWIEMY